MLSRRSGRRYKAICIAFPRYLSKPDGKSDAGTKGLGPIDTKFEHMRWLISYLKLTQSCSNFVTKITKSQNGEESQKFVASKVEHLETN